MDDWDVRPLGEVCTIKPPKAEARARLADGDEVSFAPMEDMGIGVKYLSPHRTRLFGEVSGGYTYFANDDVLLAKITPCFENGKLGIARGLTNGIGFGSSEFIVLRPNPTLYAEFLYYYLTRPTFLEEGARTMTGAVGHKRVTKEFVDSYPIPLPPLSEQHRIVAILDRAFEGIAIARANAEKNLRNSRELFTQQRAILFDEAQHFRHTTPLGDIAIVQSGGTPLVSTKEFWGGDIAWYSSGELNETETSEPERFITEAGLAASNAKLFPEGSLLVGMYDTAALKMSLLDRPAAFNQAIAGVKPNQTLGMQFLFHAINHQKPALLNLRRGVRQKNLSLGKIKDIVVPVPSPQFQRDIVDKLRKFQEVSDHLGTLYQRKLDCFDELERSLLHQAFTGQLTSTRKTFVAAKPCSKTTTPEFSANIIALGYARHLRNQRERTFGRVKEQKLLHLVEAIGKVELGRHPMKDAAGPNDFQHMLRAEDWARQNGFFELTEREGGYDFRKLSAFDELIAGVPQVLGSSLHQIEAVVDLLVSMDTEEVELFATVHAAWNNLLIDGAEVTDEAIVWQARDAWHTDKLAIPAHKFRQAISLVRSKSLVPDGSAKYVGGQKPLAFR